mmetsp:Transcript_9745/g.20604  ORF Transcript_9745/g.20604 Transcript_9745/m.20604 type:complete len:249 (-) Transcript_9745:564-1310(-)
MYVTSHMHVAIPTLYHFFTCTILCKKLTNVVASSAFTLLFGTALVESVALELTTALLRLTSFEEPTGTGTACDESEASSFMGLFGESVIFWSSLRDRFLFPVVGVEMDCSEFTISASVHNIRRFGQDCSLCCAFGILLLGSPSLLHLSLSRILGKFAVIASIVCDPVIKREISFISSSISSCLLLLSRVSFERSISACSNQVAVFAMPCLALSLSWTVFTLFLLPKAVVVFIISGAIICMLYPTPRSR